MEESVKALHTYRIMEQSLKKGLATYLLVSMTTDGELQIDSTIDKPVSEVEAFLELKRRQLRKLAIFWFFFIGMFWLVLLLLAIAVML